MDSMDLRGPRRTGHVLLALALGLAAGMAMAAGDGAVTPLPAPAVDPVAVSPPAVSPPAVSAPAAGAPAPATIGAIPAPAPRSMQTLPTPSAASTAVASAGSLTHISLVLLLVVGLIAGMAWLLRRLGMARTAGGSTVRIVSGISLSNRERILVVEIADQWLVVGVAPGCINTLATMPRQESAASATNGLQLPPGKNFAAWLKQTIDKRNAAHASARGTTVDRTGAGNGGISPGSNDGN